jgi:hypothetical protein
MSVTLNVPNYKAGTMQVATMTFAVVDAPIATGAKIIMQVPDLWGYPSVAYGTYLYSGGVRYSTTTGGGAFNATLSLVTSGQFVVISVDAGTIAVGDSVMIHYGGQSCQAGVATFRSYFMDAGCTSPNLIAAYTRTVGPGDPSFIGFDNWELVPIQGTIVPVRLVSRDNCSNRVAAGQSVPVFVSALRDPGGTGFMPDTDGQIDTAAGFSSPASSKLITFAPSDSDATIYYRISTFTASNFYNIRATYTISYDNQSSMSVKPVATGITGVSVDTGTIGTSTSAVFTPDNNGVADFVYVNFTLPNDFGWEVSFSSDNFLSFTRRYYGWGRFGRITWDGIKDSFGATTAGVAPAGIYKVRVSVSNGALKDESVEVKLQVNELKGRVQESGTFTDLGNASVDVFGPTYRYVQTGSDGRFSVNGIQPGSYNVRIMKPGYGTKEFSATVSTSLTDVGTKLLDKVSLLRLTVTRSTDVFMPDLWGNVTARSNDWSSQFYGSVHFVQGSTVSDAGDYYNVTRTSYTEISLLPNTTYQLEISIPGFNINPSPILVGPGQILSLTLPLQRRANISGYVILPATVPYSTWVSVEAGIDSNMDGTYDSLTGNTRFYGGVNINTGFSSATYNVFGVINGTYTLKAQVPGYARSSTGTIVTGGVDAVVDFPPFGSGAVIVGTVTINGDTSSLDYDSDGDVDLYINAWSPTNFDGSNTQITVTTGTVTVATYSITGLSNGNYEVGMWLNGFESSPPGPRIATVVGGTGSLNLTFNKYSGVLRGAVSLKDAATDFNNVSIEVRPLRNYGPATGGGALSTQTPLNRCDHRHE